MKIPTSKTTCAIFLLAASFLSPVFAASTTKTLRVEHGRPVILVSQTAVLLLEMLKVPTEKALVSHNSPDIRHCRESYRYQLYNGTDGSITNGQGTVEEIFKTVSRSATGAMVENLGSKTGLNAGEFSVWWSEANAGSRSWLYYHAKSNLRFIQQPRQLVFESMNQDLFKRYLTARNVEEFMGAGKMIQIMGPAVFSGDLPDETPVSGRIALFQIREGAVELKLSNLATNTTYRIESSYQMNQGNWNTVHSFSPLSTDYSWTDPLGKEVTVGFYRIRQGP